ncbi:DNA polymerase-3 subunit gamma/tau [Azotobacter beijerinckii]|uniref:DNA polymerase III subunit gamma/tau n=1 Tax=Azotobacter beijerinckii TaxID=170623 RepID=A0A1H9J7L8_9GAMM|nr:DNA polymerase III subunit gamma/tau [Azotobacter beijerinckii]SEQ82788.1 DNA polymerase-3 subunit gamma/tau [Azotobacter beijerinckii]
MSYQVLARKWRPRSFREMVGQTHVLKALINALDSQRLHHAYLFTGTRGVGKTTIARIIAKCLNCETGIGSTPCGQCSVCREIDEGRFVDLIEVDAASRTKVEDTRELLDNVQYAPTRGRFKVYLIDEVHMLSSHSFNALLKTLEEPPPHVKFLLATTDPQKLPVTILSRCLQFALKSMPPERVVEHLTHVLGAEGIPFEADALWLLGRAADGSMRDAMSLTDQAIAFGEGRVLAADVRAMLGTLDHGQVYGVLQSLLEGDTRAMLEAVRQLAEQGPDWSGVLAEMLNVLHRVAIAQALPEAVDNGNGDRERVLALAQALPAEDVQFYYQMGLIGRRDLPLAPDPRGGFEMVLLRMLAFRPADAGGAPDRPLKDLGVCTATADSSSASVADGQTVAPAASGAALGESLAMSPPSAVSASPEPMPSQELPALPAGASDLPWDEPMQVAGTPVSESAAMLVGGIDAAPAPEEAETAPESTALERQSPPAREVAALPVGDRSPERPSAPVVAEEPPPADDDYYEVDGDEVDVEAYAYLEAFPVEVPAPSRPEPEPQAEPAAAPATGLAAEWLELFQQLGLAGMTANIAANCTLARVEGNHWLLHLDPAQAALFNGTQQRRLNEALNQYHGRALKLDIELRKPEQETPAQAAARQRAERQRQAEASIQADPLIRQMIQQFAAVIRDGTIEPLNT